MLEVLPLLSAGTAPEQAVEQPPASATARCTGRATKQIAEVALEGERLTVTAAGEPTEAAATREATGATLIVLAGIVEVALTRPPVSPNTPTA